MKPRSDLTRRKEELTWRIALLAHLLKSFEQEREDIIQEIKRLDENANK